MEISATRPALLLTLVLACCSCSTRSGQTDGDLVAGDPQTDPEAIPDQPIEESGVDLPATEPIDRTDGGYPRELCLDPSSMPHVVRGPEGTAKICQLTGEFDRELGLPTINLTQTRAGIYGTDLGASFEHDGRLWFLFGDTVGATLLDQDSIASSEDADPSDCLELDFLVDQSGTWHPPVVPDISLGAFEVPMEGVSAGGAMYVYFTTDHSSAHTMGRSVLARSDDDGRTFEYVADISVLGKFINLSAVVVDNDQLVGLPSSTGQGLLIWGSGEYRQSNVALAWQPLAQIEDPTSIHYFTGTSTDDCRPQWSDSEEDATLLFEESCVGELSVQWNPHLQKWLMTYNCDDPRGIRFRTADHPWGPWSDSQSLFEPWEDGGYCHFMHVSHLFQECDEVQDPGRDNEWGGEYGPYQIGPLAEAIPGGSAITFVMSTWNPYNVVLMRSELLLQ